MNSIAKNNSNTIFSTILGDFKNLLVFISNADKPRETLEEYTTSSDLDTASIARELQQSLDSIEKGRHLQKNIISKDTKKQTATTSIKQQPINNTKLNDTKLATKNITSKDHELDGR